MAILNPINLLVVFRGFPLVTSRRNGAHAPGPWPLVTSRCRPRWGVSIPAMADVSFGRRSLDSLGLLPSGKFLQLDPENDQFIVETSLPNPTTARVYVNLPEGNSRHYLGLLPFHTQIPWVRQQNMLEYTRTITAYGFQSSSFGHGWVLCLAIFLVGAVRKP